MSRDIPVQKSAFSRDIPVQNSQSAGIFQCKIVSQQGYSSTKYAVSRDIPLQNSQSAGIFHYKIVSQQGYSGTKYAVSRDISLQNMCDWTKNNQNYFCQSDAMSKKRAVTLTFRASSDSPSLRAGTPVSW
jgi:hypothetical protein